MRVCIVFAEEGSSTICARLCQALAQGMRSHGHDVDVIDMRQEGTKIISFYDHIAVGTVASSFIGGKIPLRLEQFLRQCGTIAGKRSSAFIAKRGLRQGRTLQTLMKVMESQGMYLVFSDILANESHAKEVGKRLVIT